MPRSGNWLCSHRSDSSIHVKVNYTGNYKSNYVQIKWWPRAEVAVNQDGRLPGRAGLSLASMWWISYQLFNKLTDDNCFDILCLGEKRWREQKRPGGQGGKERGQCEGGGQELDRVGPACPWCSDGTCAPRSSFVLLSPRKNVSSRTKLCSALSCRPGWPREPPALPLCLRACLSSGVSSPREAQTRP